MANEILYYAVGELKDSENAMGYRELSFLYFFLQVIFPSADILHPQVTRDKVSSAL